MVPFRETGRRRGSEALWPVSGERGALTCCVAVMGSAGSVLRIKCFNKGNTRVNEGPNEDKGNKRTEKGHTPETLNR